MTHYSLLKIIFGLTIASIATHSFASQRPNIIITPLNETHIKLEYTLPKHCNNVELLSPYGERTQDLRKQWQALDDCGAITEQGIINKKTNCKSVSFAVPIQASIQDRIYPVAAPFDEHGVLIHTGTMAIADKCGIPLWQFKSPKGGVILHGKYRGKQITLKQDKNPTLIYTGVFLSYSSRHKKPGIIVTQQTPEWIKTSISTAAPAITHYFEQQYSALQLSRPYLFVVNSKTESAPAMQADVSHPDMMRFGFINYPDQGDAINQLTIMGTTAHEFAHRLQPEHLKATPFINEGGAEFIRWTSSYRLGWINKNDFARDLSMSISACLEFARQQSWKSISAQQQNIGYVPYKCGLALHAIGLIARQTTDSAEETLHQFYQQATPGDFAQALECGNLKNCTPRWLPRVLNSDEPLIVLIEKQFIQAGLLKGKHLAIPGTPALNFGRAAFTQLMQEDCNGAFGLWTNSDHFLVDIPANTCKTLTKELKIQRVNGVSYFDNPMEAVAKQNNGCMKQGVVTLETQNQQSIKISCTTELPLQEIYFDLDADKLVAVLDKK